MDFKWDGALLKLGVKGSSVTAMQKALNELGYDCGTADGAFGPKTQYALGQFQKENDLGMDGVLGAKSAAKLTSALAAKKVDEAKEAGKSFFDRMGGKKDDNNA